MCIDATGSMGSLINTVKKNALSFHSDLVSTLEKSSKHVDHLRVRVIAFRDYVADKMDAMLVSDFFELPSESSEFEKIVNSIETTSAITEEVTAHATETFSISEENQRIVEHINTLVDDLNEDADKLKAHESEI